MKTKILLISLVLTMMAFACSKKIEMSPMPISFMVVNYDPFVRYDEGEYDDISFDYASINKMDPPVKRFRENGLENFFYSDQDSNTFVYVTVSQRSYDEYYGSPAIFLFRSCITEDECDSYEKQHPITEIFKDEFMRLQRGGFYQTTLEYADSVSNHVIEKFKTYSDSTGTKIYNDLVYNDRCFSEPYYVDNDNVTKANHPCPQIPQKILAEFDSCNAMLDAQIVKRLSIPQTMNVDIKIQKRNIVIDGFSGEGSILLYSPLGQLLEMHHILGPNATIETRVPTGSYIVQLEGRNGVVTQKMIVQ